MHTYNSSKCKLRSVTVSTTVRKLHFVIHNNEKKVLKILSKVSKVNNMSPVNESSGGSPQETPQSLLITGQFYYCFYDSLKLHN